MNKNTSSRSAAKSGAEGFQSRDRKLNHYAMNKLINVLILASEVVILSTQFLPIKSVNAQNRSISVDEMAMILSTYVTVAKACPQQFRGRDDAPLGRIVSQYGYNLVDFTPNNRYWQLMDFRIGKAIEFLRLYGKEKGCPAMRDTVIQYLPELYR